MQTIHKLPPYLINILKAWEIVERPASVIKELIENSLDAWANNILVEIKNWWKDFIKVEDDWSWIIKEDLPLSIERYATSKIKDENDLQSINSYWFRWEALAAISEVSRFKIISKFIESEENIAFQLIKENNKIDIKPIWVNFDHWTQVIVEDLFYNTPVRRKFLKSSKTEEKYIREIFLNFAIVNFDKNFKLKIDWKVVYNLFWKESLMDRIYEIYPNQWHKHFKIVENWWWDYNIYWVISDSSLTFLSPDNIKIFVNKRPITDKIIKKAILEAYYRQLPHGEYPFAILFLEINPRLLDVNVHPRKLEVKFLDSGSVYNFVYKSIVTIFETDKISSSNLSVYAFKSTSFNFWNNLDLDFSKNIFVNRSLDTYNKKEINIRDFNLRIIWQLRNTYIILEDNDNMYIVDQHALAERVKFEKLKKDWLDWKVNSYILLNPLNIDIWKNVDFLDKKIEKLSNLGFDIWWLWWNKIVVYSVPEVLNIYKIDLNLLIPKLLDLDIEEISLEKVLDQIWATKACKTSIKAWQKLSYQEMENLIKEWFEYIKGQFVCQHWRPSFVKIPKNNIEDMFDR